VLKDKIFKPMKPKVTSVETLYESREATGDTILNQVVTCLRQTRIIAAADLAILMDVKKSYLYGAMQLLTGMALGEFICRWRLLQARELLRQGAAGEKADRVKLLDKTARCCGWRSYRVLLRVAKRYGFELES
jgi:AraC-like DNA-binding protein